MLTVLIPPFFEKEICIKKGVFVEIHYLFLTNNSKFTIMLHTNITIIAIAFYIFKSLI